MKETQKSTLKCTSDFPLKLALVSVGGSTPPSGTIITNKNANMITNSMVRFMAKFEKELAHKSVDETIAEMCGKSSVEIHNAFDYEF